MQKQVTDLEAEREQKQRDFDRKLLLAKSKIEMEEASATAGAARPAPGGLLPTPVNQERSGTNKPGDRTRETWGFQLWHWC